MTQASNRAQASNDQTTNETPSAPLRLGAESMAALVDILFDSNPDGIVVVDADGAIRINDVAAGIHPKPPDPHVPPSEWSDLVGLFHEDQVTRFAPGADPLALALQGQTLNNGVIFVRNHASPQGRFLSVSARPLPGGGAIGVMRDITEQRRLAQDLAKRNAELAEREQENRELIARLRVAVDELSTPVLEIWDDVLALPVVGIVDTQRSARMTERLLAEVVRTRCRSVIVDLTGVELIDTSTADRFLKLARSVQLLGARCLVTGIQPAVAQTLVELGVEFAALETHRNLKSALEASIRRDVAERKAQAGR